MMWYWGSGFGILMMLVFWGGIFALVVLLTRALGGPRIGQRDAALATLRKRLAAGEISPEEFERVRGLIGE